ncbi:MAG: hypothetical protein R2862_05780 [Thermoanaerobaculia bacterium]
MAPGILRGRRWENLGWASLISIFFHILLLFFFVKFVYATQLGSWSGQHYGSFGQNFWGHGQASPRPASSSSPCR